MIKGRGVLEYLSQPTAEKLIKNQEQINQLHDVLTVTRLDKQNALVRRLVKKTQDGTLGQVTAEDPADGTAEGEGEDVTEDDKVNFGDTHNVYEIVAAAEKAGSKVASSMLPVILAAALGGGGLGAAAMAIPSLLKKADTVVVQPAAGSDLNTQYTLEFSDNALK